MNKEDLIDGAYYTGHCRNATVARWDALTGRFYHWRVKFGHHFVEWIFHPDDDQTYDMFEAEAVCETPPARIPLPHEPAEENPEEQK